MFFNFDSFNNCNGDPLFQISHAGCNFSFFKGMFVVFKFFWCGVIGDKNIVSPSFILKMNNSRKNLKKFREINNNDNYNSIIARRNMYIVT